MKRSKDFRISQKQRKVQHAEKVIKEEWGLKNPYQVKEIARKLADNLHNCSCEMCRNPRHSNYNKGHGKLTTQELKSCEDFKEQVEDEWT